MQLIWVDILKFYLSKHSSIFVFLFLSIVLVVRKDKDLFLLYFFNNQQIFHILISVPPKIISNDVSADPVVREGDNLTLSCDARGHPKPHIVWRREDSEDIMVDGKKGFHLTFLTTKMTKYILNLDFGGLRENYGRRKKGFNLLL